MCFRSLLHNHQERLSELNLNLAQVIPQISQMALGLLGKFFSPNILWPIIHLITLLIEKAAFATQMGQAQLN